MQSEKLAPYQPVTHLLTTATNGVGIMSRVQITEDLYRLALSSLTCDPQTGDFTWSLNSHKKMRGKPAGSVNGAGYLQIGFAGRILLSHRLVWYHVHRELPNCLDHINRNRLDNQIDNLRVCTNAQNSFNSSLNINNSSGCAGVGWSKKANRWRSYIRVAGTQIYLGNFKDKGDAIKARKDAEQLYFGAFAPQTKLGE